MLDKEELQRFQWRACADRFSMASSFGSCAAIKETNAMHGDAVWMVRAGAVGFDCECNYRGTVFVYLYLTGN